MSTQKPTPKKKSQPNSKKVAKDTVSGSPKKKAATPAVSGKKKPGPKKGSTRKAQPEKKTAEKKAVAKKATPKKVGPKKPEIKKVGKGLGNSVILQKVPQSSIDSAISAQFSSKIRSTEDLNAMANKYKAQMDKGSLNYLKNSDFAKNPTSATSSAATFTLKVGAEIPPAPAAKKPGVFSRIASWFKPSRKRK